MSDNTAFKIRGRGFRLFLMGILVLPTAFWAMSQVYIIFQPNEFRTLEWIQLGLSSVLFLWLAMSFWTSIIGFLLKLFKRDPLSFSREMHAPVSAKALAQKHAIIMPVYNEDTLRIMAGFEATVKEIAKTHSSEKFDFYMLSDTQDQDILKAEYCAWASLLKGLPENLSSRCYYRNRKDNTGRKVGNVKDFCQRWGKQYESMVVLDADSIMTGEKLLELAQRIEDNPNVGLIQTIPMPVRQDTFFGRFVQYAAQVYSPMLATGLSFWQGDCANYWGHNAIIRVQAFIDTCGLPPLKGKQPFGGDILSHDFVEAALLRRANWQVFLLTDSQGSYEEVPSNIIDYATRDRRWVQGNMQHLALLASKGLRLSNRLHFGFGAFAYASSILLLGMLLAGTADALIQANTPPVYFTKAYQLFPTWLITKQNVMLITLWVTIALLFLPKALGILLTFIQRRHEFGGGFNFLKSTVIEFFFAVLIAPIMMMFHSYFVINVLMGKSVKWEAQAREGRMIPWLQALRFSYLLTLVGLVWAGLTYVYTPTLFIWLIPVYSGLILAAPIIRLSSSVKFGRWCLRKGIFLTNTERQTPSAIRQVDRNQQKIATVMQQNEHLFDEHFHATIENEVNNKMPLEAWSDMPLQKLSRGLYPQAEKNMPASAEL
ncbi:glucans biosynthesis glucosyltransferase MdoH [Glaciecola sp. 2405UD65-10]|uniref:glucans biosynthesis glucosyltransferase MdoH n=1 Tax=Glaciecola sp. 2405UD65-10 TaxID=3397244 RepID=UPI003B5CF2FD